MLHKIFHNRKISLVKNLKVSCFICSQWLKVSTFMTSPSCFLFSEILFTQHKIKVYTSVGFSIFIKWCNHYPYLILEHFYHPHSLSSQLLATTSLLSVSGDLAIWIFSYKWNHAMCDQKFCGCFLSLSMFSRLMRVVDV